MRFYLYLTRKRLIYRRDWLMHEFFAGSSLVAYGLKDMFSPYLVQ